MAYTQQHVSYSRLGSGVGGGSQARGNFGLAVPAVHVRARAQSSHLGLQTWVAQRRPELEPEQGPQPQPRVASSVVAANAPAQCPPTPRVSRAWCRDPVPYRQPRFPAGVSAAVLSLNTGFRANTTDAYRLFTPPPTLLLQLADEVLLADRPVCLVVLPCALPAHPGVRIRPSASGEARSCVPPALERLPTWALTRAGSCHRCRSSRS